APFGRPTQIEMGVVHREPAAEDIGVKVVVLRVQVADTGLQAPEIPEHRGGFNLETANGGAGSVFHQGHTGAADVLENLHLQVVVLVPEQSGVDPQPALAEFSLDPHLVGKHLLGLVGTNLKEGGGTAVEPAGLEPGSDTG